MSSFASNGGIGVTKIVRCKDVGVDCDFEARGSSEQEVLNQCAEHGRTAHGIQELTPELVMAVLFAMREEDEKP
jgi:predicted small metal-binding protein